MITIYKEEKNKLVLSKKKDNDPIRLYKKTWVNVVDPTAEELKKISKSSKIPSDFLLASLDNEESARTDRDGNNVLIVLDVPIVIRKEENNDDINAFETIPFVIAYNDDYFVTTCKSDTYLVSQMLTKAKKVEPHKHVRLTLLIMMALAQQFIWCLKQIDKKSKEIENKLHTSQKNKELLELMTLNKMLVYFSTALNSDKAVSEKLKRSKEFTQYTDDLDLMEDVQVEFNQAIEMCSIYRDILAGMMDAFASIISNNLNIVMKVLAIITLVISIPTLIASFWGMNVKVPLGESDLAFWIIIGISAVSAIVGAIALFILEKRKRSK